MVADAVGYTGETRWDTSKPDGTPRKPEEAARLLALAQQDVVSRWHMYEQLAALDYSGEAGA